MRELTQLLTLFVFLCLYTILHAKSHLPPFFSCMEAALLDGNVHPEEVGYINAHGTSTQLNDKIETQVW